jgi:hypothetical protein
VKIYRGRDWIKASRCSHAGPSSLHRESEEHEIPSTSGARVEDLPGDPVDVVIQRGG